MLCWVTFGIIVEASGRSVGDEGGEEKIEVGFESAIACVVRI